MTRCVVAGVGFHPFGKFLDESLKDLGAVAVLGAVRDAGLTLSDVEVAYVGNSYAGLTTGQESVRGQVILRHVGLSGIPVINVENACASGATALQQAALSVRSGAAETALAFGVEKLRALGTSTDVETMGSRGVQFTAFYAMKARQTMEAFGIPIESVARVAVKNSRNGSLNPIAQFRKPQTIGSVLHSRPNSEPLTLLMCSSIADGAAAVLLVSERKAREAGIPRPVYVAGHGLRSGEYGRREGASEPDSVRAAAHKAYEEAGIGPDDLDLLRGPRRSRFFRDGPPRFVRCERCSPADASAASARSTRFRTCATPRRWPPARPSLRRPKKSSGGARALRAALPGRDAP